MPAPNETPRWALDAVENPADDSDLDQYAPFDPQGSDVLARQTIEAANPTRKVTDEDRARTYAERTISAYNAGREVADRVEVETLSLPDMELKRKYKPRDVVNFLFGDELGAIGIKLDEREVSWSVDNAIQQWSEHPIRTTIALASWMAPVAGHYVAKARYGKIGEITGDELVKGLQFESIEAFHKASPEAVKLARKDLADAGRLDKLRTTALHHPEQMTMFMKAQLSFHDNFATKYMKTSDPSSSTAHIMDMKQRMQGIIRDEVVDPFLSDIPEDLMAAAGSKGLGLYMIGREPLSILPKASQTWAFNLREAHKAAQKHNLDVGLISQETFEHVGEVYTPLLPKNRPLRIAKGASEEILLVQGKKGKLTPVTIPRLTSDALRRRHTGLDDFEEMIRRGEAHTDPKNLTVHGLLEAKTLTLSFETLRDIAIHPKMSATFQELRDRGEDLEKWIDINHIPNSHVIRNMISKLPGSQHLVNEDRFIRLEAFEEMFGKNGMMAQGREATSALATITRTHKFAKTALNLFTHGQNISGNIMFLSQAGFRLFTGPDKVTNWNAIKNSMANVNQNFKLETGKIASASYRPIKFKKRTFSAEDIASELENPYVQDIIERGTFLNAEASNGIVSKIVDKAEDMNDALGKLAKSGNGFLESTARIYNVEDAGPKFAYYLSLRAEGFTPQMAAKEVAKRLPIYHGLAAGPKLFGSRGPRIGPASLRKWMFPWISFPAEAMRITKNNLIDYPMRMLPWLHAPQIMQSVIYGASHGLGVGEPLSYEDYGGIRKGLPIHAQRPGAVITPFKDRNDDFRAMMLDFIPHLSFGPATTAKEATFSDVNPYDIAPIFSGILGIMTGRGPFGNPIKATSKSDLVAKHISNLVGFITPPYVQKYAFSLTQPREGFNIRRFEQDLGVVTNPATGKPGSWVADMILSNTVLRNFPSSAEQKMFNENLHLTRTVDKVRGELTRRFQSDVRSGDEERATENLVQIAHTFVKEFGPGPIAQQKFMEYAIRHRKAINKHPQLRRYSLEDLTRMLIQSQAANAERRGLGLKNSIAAIRQELVMRQMKY